MKRPVRIILALVLLIPLLLVTWLTTTGSGLRWVYRQAAGYLPAGFSVGQLDGQLIGPVTMKDVSFRADDTLITAGELALDWHPAALLAGNISVTRLHIQGLRLSLPETDTSTPSQPFSLPELQLPWHTSLKNVRIDDIRISRGQSEFSLTQITLDLSNLLSRLDIDHLGIRADAFELAMQGNLHASGHYAHKLDLQWQIHSPDQAPIKGKGSLRGDMRETRLRQRVDGALQLDLDAHLHNLLDEFNWRGSVDVQNFDSAQLIADWPAFTGKLQVSGSGDLNSAKLDGQLQADNADMGPFDASFQLQRLADQHIQIDQLRLHSAVTDTLLNIRGQWLPGDRGGKVDLALDWQKLRWPLQDAAWFDSAEGNGHVKGTIDHYQLEINTDRPWPQAPPSRWYASADGDLDGLDFRTLRVSALDGEADAWGRLDWSPELRWQASLSASNIDPASLLPEWPGRLNGQLSSKGRLENQQLVIDTDIHQLGGRLRGYPVSLQSQLSWRDNGFDIRHFDFHSGSARLNASGRLGDTLQLDWLVKADSLAELYPRAQGSLNAEGKLQGPRQAPTIMGSLSGKALSLLDYQVGSIDMALNLDLASWQTIDLQLVAEALQIRGHKLDSVSISGDTQQLKASLATAEAKASIELRGMADNIGWHGHIARADILSNRYDNWRLQAPAALNIDQNSLTSESLCWKSRSQAVVCASLHHQQENWQSQLEITRLPLALFNTLLPPDLKLEGLVDASASFQLASASQLQGRAHVELAPGVVSYPLLEGERDRWEYRRGSLDLLLDNQGISVTSDIAMNNGDALHFNGLLPDAQLLTLTGQQAIQARAQLQVHDLGLIEALLPEVQDLKGDMGFRLTAKGTLAAPLIEGQAQLRNGGMRIPRLGLTIEQLFISAENQGPEKLVLHMEANSGEGKLLVQGETRLDSKAGWPTVISIKGEQFEVSRIPEARVQISPDLLVKLQHRTVHISGNVAVPFAKLQPRDITTAEQVSDDAVIVGGEQTPEQKWAIYTKIRITLGDRVTIFGFGFDGRLGGSLLLEDEPGQLTRATGEITIPEGRYRAYGQRLDVENGRLLYTGGPVGNPGLDLRAVRHINNVTAGLKVRGSLNQPVLELFSTPAMGETDTLSYIILGRPMENASGEEGAAVAKAALALGLSGGDRLARLLGDRFGLDEMRVESSESGDQASLVVGRYLSPKIYISYGVGLIEAVNTFTVRYQISDKWQIKAESGEAQGADILYTIER